jgi:outer membrane cobalamin receptor
MFAWKKIMPVLGCLLGLGFRLVAGVDASISGLVFGLDGKPSAKAEIGLADGAGRTLTQSASASDGSFSFQSLDFGDYLLKAKAADGSEAALAIHLASGEHKQLRFDLGVAEANADEVVIKAHRNLLNGSDSTSRTEVSSKQIDQLPGGTTQSLPKVLFSTNPGFVQGSFGQVFTRGNHANLQYDIDGIQLPDSVSGTFGDAFSVLNIERMEVITGGMPAEYGNRLSGVVNILTKSGGAEPGGTLDLNYGSFNTFDPQLTYGGSSDEGHLRYFISGSYSSTERGLDTPQPAAENNQNQGGTEIVHDASTGNNQFGKLDWDVDSQNTLMLTAFNSQRSFQIPDYPSKFLPTDAFFSPAYTDAFTNAGSAWSSSGANDYQLNGSDYVELMWKHKFSDDSLLQLAPYLKYSTVIFNGDPANDLSSANLVGTVTAPVNASSFFEDRVTSDTGIQGDYSLHPNQANAIKAGFQLQAAEAHGPITVLALSTGQAVTATSTDDSADHDYQESVYVQDDVTIVENVVLNVGLRYDAIQFLFPDATSLDGEFQPRLGLSVKPWSETKLHFFYGKLFQPAPAEDLRDTFANLGQGTLAPYDIKAEKDDYYEVGAAQQVADQLVSVNAYYKDAINLIDDTQLLNTAIVEPYNYVQGYVYGVEASVVGHVTEHVSDFLTYTYEIAQGSGASGGLFALPPGTVVPTDWKYLDHCQINTANAGLTYTIGGFSLGATCLYGSGLRSGPTNNVALPPHFTADGTVSYAIKASSWLSDLKLALDVTNIFDNIYPINVDNGYNGTHYAAPTAFTLHIIKAL